MLYNVTEQTLRNISKYSPKWADAIREGDPYDIDLDKRMADFSTCVVGEAHGFSDAYEYTSEPCKDCVDYAIDFAAMNKDLDRQGREDVEKVSRLFNDHFKSHHEKGESS